MINEFIAKNLIKKYCKELVSGNKDKTKETISRIEDLYKEQPNSDLGLQLYFTIKSLKDKI